MISHMRGCPALTAFFQSACLLLRLKNHIVWMFPRGFHLGHLDFEHYLPLFMAGLSIVEEPYDYLAAQGVRDMVAFGGKNHRLHVCVDPVATKLKELFKNDNPAVAKKALLVMKQLMTCDKVTATEPEERLRPPAKKEAAEKRALEGSAAGELGIAFKEHFKGDECMLRTSE